MLISVKYLFDVYFYVNLKNAVSFVRFRSGFVMLQFVTSNSSISENTICTWVFFYSIMNQLSPNISVYLSSAMGEASIY